MRVFLTIAVLVAGLALPAQARMDSGLLAEAKASCSDVLHAPKAALCVQQAYHAIWTPQPIANGKIQFDSFDQALANCAAFGYQIAEDSHLSGYIDCIYQEQIRIEILNYADFVYGGADS